MTISQAFKSYGALIKTFVKHKVTCTNTELVKDLLEKKFCGPEVILLPPVVVLQLIELKS